MIHTIGLYLYRSPLGEGEGFKQFWVFGLKKHMTRAVHIGKIVERYEKVLNVMRSLAGCEWGGANREMLLIDQAMIRSIIDYGSFCIWVCF